MKSGTKEKLYDLLKRYSFPAVIMLLAVFRFLSEGFRYFPQLDDYIQYHYYYALNSDHWQVILEKGLLASRPLAGIFDVYFWSLLWDAPYAALFIISLLFGASALLFSSVFSRFFGRGKLFSVIYLLLPLNFEGTYWLSASTRLVPGLFFTALSLYLLVKLCDKKKDILAIPYFICLLLSIGYYEQIAAFSVILQFVFAVMLWKRRSLYCLATLPAAGIYFAFTSAFAGGMLSDRMKLIFPITRYYFEVFFPEVARQMGAAFIKGGILTVFRGFVRGMGILFSSFGGIAFLLFSLFFAFLVFFMKRNAGKNESGNAEKTAVCKKCAKEWKLSLFEIAFGLFVALVGVMVFFFIDGTVWFSLRNTLPGLVGASLAAEGAVYLILSSERIKRNLRELCVSSVSCALAFIFLVSGASEARDYKLTYQNDQNAVEKIIEAVERDGREGRIGILNLNANYLTEQNYYFHEHIHGVTESDWALSGALSAYYLEQGLPTPKVVPLATDGYTYSVLWNREAKRIDGFDRLYFYLNGELISVTAEAGENCHIIKDGDGKEYARVWWEDEVYTYIEMYV